MDKDYIISTRYQKILKILHIIFATSIFGGLLSILTILIVKKSHHMIGESVFPLDLSIVKIFTWEVNYAFFALILTSFIFGLFTEWRFIKHRWIVFKWIVVLVMFAVTWFGLGPAINGMTSISDAGLNNSILSSGYSNFQQKAFIFTLIELVSVLIIFLISVFKPWGINNVKRNIKQKTVIMILLPIIVITSVFATVHFMALSKIRNTPIKNVNLTKISDKTYKGKAKAGNYTYIVEVKIKNHKIINIEGSCNRKSPYVTYAKGVFTKIIKQQKIDVDSVTGATTTSKAFMEAVENALNE